MAPKIIPDSVREVVSYDPDTGQISGRKACKNKLGYMVVRIDYQLYYVHRLAWFLHYGEQPTEIDHINRNPSDNRIANLRNVTHAVNQLNNGRRGVSFSRTHGGIWIAQYKRKFVYQGKDLLMAHFRRRMAVIEGYHLALPPPPTA